MKGIATQEPNWWGGGKGQGVFFSLNICTGAKKFTRGSWGVGAGGGILLCCNNLSRTKFAAGGHGFVRNPHDPTGSTNKDPVGTLSF